jgi:hypothetical protein
MPIISSVSGNFSPIGRSRRPKNSVVGGTITYYTSGAKNYAVNTFDVAGSYTMNVNSALDPFNILVIGSGGNGGGEGGGGGGGGSSALGSISNLVAGSYAVTISAAGGTTTVSFPTPIIRAGAGAGTSPYPNVTYYAGGSGGSSCPYDCCGGGSGSGGITSSITGTLLGYGGGGGGGSHGCTNGSPSAYQLPGGAGANGGGGGGTGGSGNVQWGSNGGPGVRGGGGGGAGAYAYTGGTGSSGVFIISYEID